MKGESKMVAVLSMSKISRGVQSFGLDDLPAKTASRMRLPASEEDALRWLFFRLEGEIGLRSNFGDMCNRLEASKIVADRPLEELEPEGTPPSPPVFDEIVQESTGVRLAMTIDRAGAYGRARKLRARRKRMPLSERVPRETMHVRSAAPHASCQDQPFETWACWSNRGLTAMGKPRLGQSVLDARRTLLRMLGAGDLHNVFVLATMYGEEPERATDPSAKPDVDADGKPLSPEPPPWRWVKDFGMLDDVVRLAPMTKIVLEHVEKMNAAAREGVQVAAFERDLMHAETAPRAAAMARAALDRVLLQDDGSEAFASVVEEATERARQCERSARAARLTVDDVTRHAEQSRVFVTPLEALYDLLIPRSGENKIRREARKLIGKRITSEATSLLINACKSYRLAKQGVLAQTRIPPPPVSWRRRSLLIPVVGYRNGMAVLSCGHETESVGSRARRCRECERA
jgi:hypothetical protein